MMKVAVCLVVFSLLISCGSDVEVESTGNTVDAQDIDTTESDALNEDSEILSKIVFPPAILDDPCLPYPSEEFLYNLEYDSLSFKYSEEYNLMYQYLVAHFDSLAPKKRFDVKDEYDMGTYHWEQNFSNGIKYEEFFGGEGGAIAILTTQCSNRLAVFSTLNPLVNYDPYPNDAYPDDATWNDDSTAFSPEGAGCYYDIIKNDTTGFFFIDNYCGC